MNRTTLFTTAMAIAAAPMLMAAEANGFMASDLILPVSLTVLGLFLMIMEATVIPGFGVAGVSGIIVLGAGFFFGARDLSVHILDMQEGGVAAVSTGIIGALCGCLAVSVVFIKLVPNLPGAKRLILNEEMGNELHASEKKLHAQVGASGVVRTDLRPAGKVRIGDEDFDVTTKEGFISAGVQVIVDAVEDGHMVVKRVV